MDEAKKVLLAELRHCRLAQRVLCDARLYGTYSLQSKLLSQDQNNKRRVVLQVTPSEPARLVH